MRYRLAIFDLDGTLADSFAWFLRHCNDVADRYGFRRMIENGELTAFGHELRHAGSREILTRLDLALWKLPLISRHVRRLKTAHIDDITLFPGTTEMLRALKEHGLTLALVSSDHEKNVRRQLGGGQRGAVLALCLRRLPVRQGGEISPCDAPRRRRARAGDRHRR